MSRSRTIGRLALVATAAVAALPGVGRVAAPALGKLRAVVVEGTTGVLVPPHNPVALARAIRSLLEDPIRLEGFGLAAAAPVAGAGSSSPPRRLAGRLRGASRAPGAMKAGSSSPDWRAAITALTSGAASAR